MPNLPDVAVARLADAYAAGASARTVATRFEIDEPSVRRRLLAAGVMPRPPSVSERGYDNVLTAEVLTDAHAGGHSIAQLARQVGCKPETVQAYIARLGLEVEFTRDDPTGDPRLDDADWLAARHVDDGWSVNAIARELHVAKTTVRRRLRHYGIVTGAPAATHENTLNAPALHAAIATGRPTRQVAAEAGCTASTVRYHAGKHGLSFAPE